MKNFTTHFVYSGPVVRKAVMLVTAVLFFIGYYYVCSTSMGFIREMRIVTIAALMGLCIFGTIFLLADSNRARSRRILALQMVLVALAAGLTLIKIISGPDAVSSHIVSPGKLLYGNTFAFVLLLYPFEQLSRQRMTHRDYSLLFLPALLCALFFYGYTRLGGPVTDLKNWQALADNFYKFDVWFRVVLFIYPVWLFTRILYKKKCYISWYSRNFANAECADLAWLDYYLFGYFLILGSYQVVMLTDNLQSRFLHSLLFLLFFGFMFYHILRHRAPDASDGSSDENPAESDARTGSDCARTDCDTAVCSDDKYRFVDKIPNYKIDLERWMLEQKPYKNKDFKLLDVMQVLPLNRTYISRLFNEGYGETFFDFVMHCRLEESVRLLERHPEINIRRISEQCGFSSPSVFGRAFLKNKGVTPKQYRREMGL